MTPLTVAQKTRILDAVFAMDPYAWSDCPSDGTLQDCTHFAYDGYLSFDGLVHLAAVIATLQGEQAVAQPSSCCPTPFSP